MLEGYLVAGQGRCVFGKNAGLYGLFEIVAVAEKLGFAPSRAADLAGGAFGVESLDLGEGAEI